MARMITVKAARELALALTQSADRAEMRGETEFSLLNESKNMLTDEQAELAKAIQEREANEQKG